MVSLTQRQLINFEKKYEIVTESGCWLWNASWTKAGYGQVNINCVPMYAHRISYEIHKGYIPTGMRVCHKCDTPCCINPHHLFLGTALDNMRDMDSKGRRKGGKRILTENDVSCIFNSNAMQKDLAKIYGVNRVTISDIKTGRAWSSITGKYYNGKRLS